MVNLRKIPEMSSGMEEYKIPAWTRDKMFPSPDRPAPSGQGCGILHKVLLQDTCPFPKEILVPFYDIAAS
jgi:hypothetical protein